MQHIGFVKDIPFRKVGRHGSAAINKMNMLLLNAIEQHVIQRASGTAHIGK